MRIILQTSRAEEREAQTFRNLERAIEFGRLYGVGILQHQTLMERVASTPGSANSLLELWQRSIQEPSRVAVVDSLNQADERTREQNDAE